MWLHFWLVLKYNVWQVLTNLKERRTGKTTLLKTYSRWNHCLRVRQSSCTGAVAIQCVTGIWLYLCVEPIVLKSPLIRDTIVASNRHLENTPKKPLCRLPQTVSNSTSITIGGWKRCLTIIHSNTNMKVRVTLDACQSKVFQFYKCARKIDKGNAVSLTSPSHNHCR